MSNDASKVKLIKDGEIWFKEYEPGETEPTGIDFDPSAHGYIHWGYYSDDGATWHIEAGDTTTFKAQNGEDVLSDDEPGFVTVKFSALESLKEVIEAYWNTTVQPDGSYKVETVGSTKRYSAFIRGIDQTETLIIVSHLPQIKVSDREDVVFNPKTLRAHGLTFRTFKDDGLGYHMETWDALLDSRPIVTDATPSDAITGATVTITGINFTDTTQVKFGASNATSFEVVSDTEITAVMPAGSAGSAAIKVTTDSGDSNVFAYTRGGSGG